MKAYSRDIREKIITVWKKKQFTLAEIADRFDVSVKSVQRYVGLYKKTGNLSPRKRMNRHLLKIDHAGDMF